MGRPSHQTNQEETEIVSRPTHQEEAEVHTISDTESGGNSFHIQEVPGDPHQPHHQPGPHLQHLLHSLHGESELHQHEVRVSEVWIRELSWRGLEIVDQESGDMLGGKRAAIQYYYNVKYGQEDRVQRRKEAMINDQMS